MITTGQRPQDTTSSQEQQPHEAGGGYTVEEVVDADEQLEAPPGSKLSWYVKRRIKGHTKKLSLLARQVRRVWYLFSKLFREHGSFHSGLYSLSQIRGLGVNEAIAQMRFSEKRRGAIVAQAVKRAAQKADFYHELSTDDLIVHNAYVGKDGPQPKRPNIHARGKWSLAEFSLSFYVNLPVS